MLEMDLRSSTETQGFANSPLLPPSGSSCRYDHAKVSKISKRCLTLAISEEEMEIRREIEREIERDLEEEIKGGIYQQALRLHRLYQHQKQGKSANINPLENNKELLEVNISIKVDGGTKVEIKETKRESPESCRPRTARTPVAASDTKRLDWVKSLRSSAAPAAVRRSKMPGSDSDQCRCHKPN